MGLFDWIGRRGRGAAARVEPAPAAWQVSVEGDDIVADDGRGHVHRVPLGGAQSVRVVPLTAGNHHSGTSGWQVALAHAEGDVLLGKPFADWQTARDVARQVCDRSGLPLHELTERMFSRVGQYAAPQR